MKIIEKDDKEAKQILKEEREIKDAFYKLLSSFVLSSSSSVPGAAVKKMPKNIRDKLKKIKSSMIENDWVDF